MRCRKIRPNLPFDRVSVSIFISLESLEVRSSGFSHLTSQPAELALENLSSMHRDTLAPGERMNLVLTCKSGASGRRTGLESRSQAMIPMGIRSL